MSGDMDGVIRRYVPGTWSGYIIGGEVTVKSGKNVFIRRPLMACDAWENDTVDCEEGFLDDGLCWRSWNNMRHLG